jgi:16S rRNA (guanine966-N2)-methyltransferase
MEPNVLSVRVIAGTARGRRLIAPAGPATRPSGDRVREATFNALHSLAALDGATVLDLFAGSGSLGIEALSRGAASATFVDSDRHAIDAVRANLEATALSAAAEVVQSDANRFIAAQARRWDLALLDPPYAFGGWDELLERVPADLAVIESGTMVTLPPGWQLVREKRYGTTVVAIARREEQELHT